MVLLHVVLEVPKVPGVPEVLVPGVLVPGVLEVLRVLVLGVLGVLRVLVLEVRVLAGLPAVAA